MKKFVARWASLSYKSLQTSFLRLPTVYTSPPFRQERLYAAQASLQTQGCPAGADHAMVVRGACGAAEETAGDAEGNAAQLNGRQTGENRLFRKLQFHLT